MSYSISEIRNLIREEKQKHFIFRPLAPPNTVIVKPLKNGKVIQILNTRKDENVNS